MANRRGQLKVAHHGKPDLRASTPLRGRPVTRRANRRAASGRIEQDYAAPAFTDSRQRRSSTQFSTQRGNAAEFETPYLLVTAANWSSEPECPTSLPSWSCGFDSRPAGRGPARQSARGDRKTRVTRLGMRSRSATHVLVKDHGPDAAELAARFSTATPTPARERSRLTATRSDPHAE